MTKRPALSCLPLLLLLAALFACRPDGERADGAGDRPENFLGAAAGWNVLLLTVDTLRADRLGVYGYQGRRTSPRIDGLLASGVLFQRAMAPRALTWPTLASVLTGLYPRGHGVLANGYRFSEDAVTLPKLLGARGYRTGAFLSNMCQANHQGWDAFACSGGEDLKTLRRALDWMASLDGADGNAPFFLWVHLFGAHPPYYNGGDLARQVLDPGYEGPLGTTKRQLDRVMTEPIELTPRDLRHLNAIYDAAVMGTDGVVGDLLDGLDAAGKLQRTLVVFLADHGEELYEHHGYLYHACSVYQTTLHVPLGFAAPGLLPPGRRVPETVELIDVTPTLLALLGIPAPADLHGVSLTRYLAGEHAGSPGKPAFSEYEGTGIQTVLAGNWKFIHNPRGVHPQCLEGVPPDFYPLERVELYDLARDPGEEVNLVDSHPEKVRELQELVRRRFAALPDRSRPQEIPGDLKEQLRALGYLAN